VTGILAETNAREMMLMTCDSTGWVRFIYTQVWKPLVSIVTYTDRYVQHRDPDRVVKPQPLKLPRPQEGDHMRRLAVLTIIIIIIIM